MSQVPARKPEGSFRFEKLEVGQEARRPNLEVYRLSRGFPASEQFALPSQMRRASVSIAANIAEGPGRNSDRDFAHFFEQSHGSTLELASHLFLAIDREYLDGATADSCLDRAKQLAARIAALNRSLQIKQAKVKL